jgi:1-acyl-sn-glycerol-3-phosphate acyltransferase
MTAVTTRERLVCAILDFLTGQDPRTLCEIRAALLREIEAAGDAALLTLRSRLDMDAGWDYYPRDPLAQRIHHVLAERFLQRESRVFGTEHLAMAAAAPVAIVANHLSYADANVLEVLLQRAGHTALANRLTAIAGPKVFTSRVRRFSSLCFGTIKVPQSTEVSSEEAVLSAREVAMAARRAIDVAHARLAAGDALLLFAEGTRSRTGAMQPMLAGAARYLEAPGTWILPVGLAGSEALFPIGHATVQPARASVHIGRPIPADDLFASAGGDRRVVMDAVGLAVAEVLPPGYRGVYGQPEALDAAAAALANARPAVV